MNREQRAQMGQATLAILEQGSYRTPDGQPVSIRAALDAACAATRLYRPDDYTDLLDRIAPLPRYPDTTITLSNQTTLAAGHALAATYPVLACLNFASAKNPGGGFLSGSQAQEESLARSSGLYATLQTQPAFYTYHRHLKTSLYSDHVIFAPGVPVFRDDAGQLLAQPWTTSFITAAAVNAGAVRKNEPRNRQHIRPTLEQRTRMLLAVAATHRCEALVLGAWGCGVFQNDPQEVAEVFAGVLAEPLFQQRFRQITFAVFDPSRRQGVFHAFQSVLQRS